MRLSRIVLIGCGVIALPVVLVVAWLAIALFPGFGGMDSEHHPFRSVRAKERYLSLYGYGRSVDRRRLESAGDFTAWLDELFDGLGFEASGEPIRLVGLSYGGWQAARYALHRPERLDALALVAPAGTVQPLSGEWIGRAVLMVLPLRRFTEGFFHWLMADWAARGTAGGLRLEDEIDFVYRGIRSFRIRELVHPGLLEDDQLRSLGLGVPTLFLVGENEKIYSPERAVERLHQVAPGIETRVIQDAGHDLTVVQADRVDAAILEFLDEPPA